MELDELLLLLNGTAEGFDGNTLAGAFLEIDDNTFNYAAEYDPLQHNVHHPHLRPDKQIKKPDPLSDDPDKLITATVPVARISVPLQKFIVKLRAQFLVGNPIDLDCSPESEGDKSMLEGVQKIWEDNKLDYKSKFLAKLLFSECECAELWYADENNDNYWQGTSLENVVRQSPAGETITDGKVPIKYRVRVLARSLGDTLLPMFDASGDMIAFGRAYTVGKTERLDIYTADFIHQGSKTPGADQTWNFEDPISHGLGKIPVIYYAQNQPEWFDVQPMINRLETLLSNNADTNDYFGSPTAVASGNIISYADKGESGKMIQLENDAKMSYLTWDAVPQSIKMEVETLTGLIFSMTSTPNISFEEMKGLGHFSGIALKMLFMAAHMEASDKEEIFGECIQRRINLLKQFMTVVSVTLKPSLNMRIKPKFEYYLPKDDKEQIDNIKTALDAGIMTQDAGVRANPLIEDADAEIKLLNKQQKKKDDAAAALAKQNQPVVPLAQPANPLTVAK
jgi:hypothetical protein